MLGFVSIDRTASSNFNKTYQNSNEYFTFLFALIYSSPFFGNKSTKVQKLSQI